MDSFEIFKLEESDIEAIFEIENALIGKVGIESIKDSLNSKTNFYFILKLNDEIIGFYEISVISPEVELFDIAIKTDFQGRGLSKLLMNHLINFCKENDVDTIFLEVNSINNKAINLYKKFGFEQYSIRKNYYGDNDAILMKKQIN